MDRPRACFPIGMLSLGARWLGLSIAMFLMPISLGAQQTPEPADAAARARSILESALSAMGSDEAVQSMRTLALEADGWRRFAGQGTGPDSPVRTFPLRVEWWVDFEGGRVSSSQTTYQQGVPYFGFRSVYAEEASFTLERETHIYFNRPAESAERARQERLDKFPEPRSLLKRALAASPEYLGERRYLGKTHRVLKFEDERGTTSTLFFDPETDLLRKVERDPVTTALVATVPGEEYGDYRTVHGITMPFRVKSTRVPRGVGTAVVDEFQYSNVRFNLPVPDSLFAEPAESFPRRPDTEPLVTEIREGIYFIENARPNYNQLVVEFADYLLVVEAPEGTSDETYTKIREALPDKPIRYLVLTHFHYDHIGDLPRYVGQGSRVVTTPGNRGFVAELVGRVATREPVLGSTELSVETVGRNRTISDGNRRVELYEIGPTPHSDEMLVVYLPEQKILYVADLFSADWGQRRPAIPETFALARQLQEMNLEIQTILPGHGPAATMRDLEWALAEGTRKSLQVRHFAHSSASFSANSYLVYGPTDAILVDVPESRSDAEALIAGIRSTGKVPSRIFVTHGHPDHFLALDRLVEAFPAAEVVSSAAVAARLEAIGPRMVEAMKPGLGEEAPERFVPVRGLETEWLELDGLVIQVLGFGGGEDRVAAALLLPGSQGLIAGDLVYNRAHLYLGNKDPDVWLGQLEEIERLEVQTLYPGHGPPADVSAVAEMRRYMSTFAEAVAGDNAAAAVEAMTDSFPDYSAIGLLEQFSIPAYLKAGE